MKKLLAFVLCCAMCFSFSACGGEEPSQKLNNNIIIIQQEEPTKPESKTDYETTVYPVKTWVNSIGTPYAQIIVGVKNTGNSNLYLSSGTMDLEDASGALFASRNLVSVFPEIIAPGETAYYYEEAMLDSPAPSDLTVIPHIDVEEAYIDMIRCPVTDVTIGTTDYGEIKVMGRVENTTGKDQQMLYVSVMLFGSDGNPLGNVFNILEISADDKMGFECVSLSFPEGITADDVASYTAFAYPAQFQF